MEVFATHCFGVLRARVAFACARFLVSALYHLSFGALDALDAFKLTSFSRMESLDTLKLASSDPCVPVPCEILKSHVQGRVRQLWFRRDVHALSEL